MPSNTEQLVRRKIEEIQQKAKLEGDQDLLTVTDLLLLLYWRLVLDETEFEQRLAALEEKLMPPEPSSVDVPVRQSVPGEKIGIPREFWFQLGTNERRFTELLLKRMGQTVSYETIYREVWPGVEYSPDDRSLAYAVANRMRDKLAQFGYTVKNKSNLGYMLVKW